MNSPTQRSGTPQNIGSRAFITLGAIGFAALILLVVLWLLHPGPTSLEFEAAKTCLQVIGLVFLGGVVALATSSIEASRKKEAEARQAQVVHQVALQQYRDEAFKIQAELLETAARCAARMYVVCRQVARLQECDEADIGLAHGSNAPRVPVSKLLRRRYLEFAAEGLTVQTQIDARFASGNTIGVEPGKGSDPIESGESSLLWHQVYDLLTVYYYSLTGTFPDDLLERTSKNATEFHSGVELLEMVPNIAAPTSAQLRDVQACVQREYARVAMPRLADALLTEQLVAPSPPS